MKQTIHVDIYKNEIAKLITDFLIENGYPAESLELIVEIDGKMIGDFDLVARASWIADELEIVNEPQIIDIKGITDNGVE